MTVASIIGSFDWDYTCEAPFYHLRPNYAPEAIDALCRHADSDHGRAIVAADVGAGTANLTLMLVERGVCCLAIEPNAAMRAIGIERTRDSAVRWVGATAESTSLAADSVDLFAMGSSFNCTDRVATLAEAHRVLKPGGRFACMWNHRDVDGDPTQKRVEAIIREEVPDYSPGVRRQDQTAVIRDSGLFDDDVHLAFDHVVACDLDRYLGAWQSVRSPYWDLRTENGAAVIQRILARLREALTPLAPFRIPYTTRMWFARRAN